MKSTPPNNLQVILEREKSTGLPWHAYRRALALLLLLLMLVSGIFGGFISDCNESLSSSSAVVVSQLLISFQNVDMSGAGVTLVRSYPSHHHQPLHSSSSIFLSPPASPSIQFHLASSFPLPATFAAKHCSAETSDLSTSLVHRTTFRSVSDDTFVESIASVDDGDRKRV